MRANCPCELPGACIATFSQGDGQVMTSRHNGNVFLNVPNSNLMLLHGIFGNGKEDQRRIYYSGGGLFCGYFRGRLMQFFLH